jgi:hypothetical protein
MLPDWLADTIAWIIGAIFHILVVAVIALALIWMFGGFEDDPPGRCRQELGYMGQVEYVDCEPAP